MLNVDPLSEAVINVLTYAYVYSPEAQAGRLDMDAAAERMADDSAAIYANVQGNKAPGSRISEADQAAIIESALRRALEIVAGK